MGETTSLEKDWEGFAEVAFKLNLELVKIVHFA
jgi:hypothetical protein